VKFCFKRVTGIDLIPLFPDYVWNSICMTL